MARHIRHTHEALKDTLYWCGRPVRPMEWAFTDLNHAAYSQAQDSIQPCALCCRRASNALLGTLFMSRLLVPKPGPRDKRARMPRKSQSTSPGRGSEKGTSQDRLDRPGEATLREASGGSAAGGLVSCGHLQRGTCQHCGYGQLGQS